MSTRKARKSCSRDGDEVESSKDSELIFYECSIDLDVSEWRKTSRSDFSRLLFPEIRVLFDPYE